MEGLERGVVYIRFHVILSVAKDLYQLARDPAVADSAPFAP